MSNLQRKGIFVGPEGSLDVPKDSNPLPAFLMERRSIQADKAFEEADLPTIADYDNNWTEDGVFFSKKVYWEGEETSVVGSFGVEFYPDSQVIRDTWNN